MEFKEFGMGTYGWMDNDLLIYGGFRDDGHHPPGKMRAKFMILDVARAIREKKQVSDQLGSLVLIIDLAKDDTETPSVSALINLELNKDARGDGLGRKIVEAVRSIANDDIEICDIKPSSKGFWEKVGASDFSKKAGKMNATLPVQRTPTPTP